ncbi:cbb3-type cytochrome oxidase assembly protein CcoS [Aestuariirhabdus sp. LZHN29]|uniref:cbb3-type cytochrome oxidase assembly protein CcoS n=1 Tax=Aestuariirhabdus sp. LZHN29 TaxID=3417462 RepID=UPI003CF1660F
MESIYLLIPIALLFVGLGVWIFFWAVDNGQFDDLEGPAHSILFDDELPSHPAESATGEKPPADTAPGAPSVDDTRDD